MSHPTQPEAKKKKWPRWARAAAWFFGALLVLQLITYLGINWYADRQPGGKDGFEKTVTAKIKMQSIEFLIGLKKRSLGRYPTEAEGLASVFSQKETKEEVIGEPDEVRDKLLDPWGRRFRYSCPGVHNKDSYDLYSFGFDGIEDTEDDIKNW